MDIILLKVLYRISPRPDFLPGGSADSSVKWLIRMLSVRLLEDECLTRSAGKDNVKYRRLFGGLLT
jgi:hypothetical protein